VEIQPRNSTPNPYIAAIESISGVVVAPTGRGEMLGGVEKGERGGVNEIVEAII